MRRVLVAGATGTLGSAIVRHLSAGDFQVRALVRKPEPAWVQHMQNRGVELAPGDVLRPISLRSVFDGIDCAISTVTRSGRTGLVEGRGNINLIEAARNAGVEQFLFVSAVGANLADGVPDLGTKGQVEFLLRDSGLHYTIVRPTLYHESLPHAIPGGLRALLGNTGAGLRRQRHIAFVTGGRTAKFGWIAADDVARVIVACCGEPEWYRATLELSGPELLTFDEALAALGRGLGRSIALRHIPLRLARMAAPFSARLSELVGRMAFLDQYGAAADTTFIAERFAFQPRSVEAWARELQSATVE